MSPASPTGMTGRPRAGLRFVTLDGTCWRAVATGKENIVLAGTVRAGRWNRPGERALYMSGSPAGVAAAMARYGDAPRTIVKLTVAANRLIDLRDPVSLACMTVAPEWRAADWRTALATGGTPPSWLIADAARAGGAAGLIDPSRHLPGAWHVVLFGWNAPGEPVVTLDEVVRSSHSAQ